MIGVQSTKARLLAMKLASLDAANRKMLLAEIPLPKREELERFLEELQPLSADSFAFQMAVAELEDDSAVEPLTEQYMLQLLTREPFAVKQQLIDMFAHKRFMDMTPHVRALIGTYIKNLSDEIPKETVSLPQAKSWWKIWAR